MVRIFKYKNATSKICVSPARISLQVSSTRLPVKLADALDEQLEGVWVVSILSDDHGVYTLLLERTEDYSLSYGSEGEFINAVAEVISGLVGCDVAIVNPAVRHAV